MDKELAKKIKESPIFNELKEYITSKVWELNTIVGIDKLPNLDAGELVRARAMAIVMLGEILSPFFDFKEKKEPTDEDIKIRSKKFGL